MGAFRPALATMLSLVILAGAMAVVSAQTDDTTGTGQVGGGPVYGDPVGRFTLPFVGDWIEIETDGSYGHFRLAEPALDAYVVAVEPGAPDAVADAALATIGHDRAGLQSLGTLSQGRWTYDVYVLDDERGITLATQQLGDATFVFMLIGDLSATTVPPAEAFLTLDGLAFMPLAEYRAFEPPATPSTIEAIEDLDRVPFHSGGQRLMGRLVLPDGEGPFPAVVFVAGSGPETRDDPAFVVPALQDAGIASFSYDKRGAGESEGIFVGTEDMTGSPTPSEWRLPQLAGDALAAVEYLQGIEEIDPERIGLLGYSQAGWVIPQVAAMSDIPAFAVIIIGPAVSVGEVNFHQELTGKPKIMDALPENERESMSAKLAAFDGPRGFDPRLSIEQMSVPGLWILGDRDGWIPARETRDFLERMAIENGKDFTVVYDPDGGHVDRPSYLDEAVDWIVAHLDT